MGRINNLKEIWCNYNVLLRSWFEVKRSKSLYNMFIKYENNLAVNLSNILSRLESDSYKITPYRQFYIQDPKERLIEAPCLNDRIVQHALMFAIKDIIQNKLIYYTFACIENRGTHKASDILLHWLKNYRNEGYYLKIDIKKFFYNIDHETLKNQVRKIIKCEPTLNLLFSFFENETGKGLPLGNVTSQLLANLALNPVDHFIKRTLKIKHYVRYMDDMILLHSDINVLRNAKTQIINLINSLNLEVNNKTKISQIKDGIDFVGYRTWYNRRLIRKRSLFKIKKAFKQNPTIERLTSFLGHAKRTDSIKYILNFINNN